MAYPIRHKLLTVNGTAWGSETWTFGMRIIPPIDSLTVSQAQVDACQPIISTWWNTVGNAFTALVSMAYIKLAPIGTDGLYPAGEDAVENMTGMPDAGAGGTSSIFAPQCTVAISLLTSASRGRGHIGRFYVPPLGVSPDATGRLSTSTQASLMNTTRTMINGLNGVAGLGTVGVITKIGSGTSRAVTGVRVGRAIDTQRRRRRSIPEEYTSVAL